MAIEKSSSITYKCKPAVPYEAEIPLTVPDVALLPGYNSKYLCCFEAPSDPSYQAQLTESLKISLESLLSEQKEEVLSLPEILGNLYIDPPNNKYLVKITKDSSVDFVVSHRYDLTYEGLEPQNAFPMRCLPGEIYASGISAFPTPDQNKEIVPFSAQITFIQRGFVICVSKHHWLIDGTAFSNLVKWWFKKTRNLIAKTPLEDSSILPTEKLTAIHDRTSLLMESNVEPQEHIQWKVVPGCPQSTFGMIHSDTFPGSAPPTKGQVQSNINKKISQYLPAIREPMIGNSIFHFSPASLKQLHSDLQSNTKLRISTNDAVSALIWRCVTRSRFAAWDKPSRPSISQLTMAVNGRAKLLPPLSPEYFGNCVFMAPSEMPIDMVIAEGSATLASVAEAVRLSLKTQTDTYMRSLIQMGKAQNSLFDMVMNSNVFMGHDIFITSWERYFDSLDELDVGAGTFKSLRLPGDGGFDGFISILPAYGMRGSADRGNAEVYTPGLEISVDLFQQHLDILKNDSEWLRYCTWTEA